MINDLKGTPNVNVPFAHIIHSNAKADVLTPVFNAISTHLGDHLVPAWVLVDDADNEIAAVQASNWGRKGCRVGLCMWHVKRAWLLNVLKKYPGKANYAKRRDLFDACCALQGITARPP